MPGRPGESLWPGFLHFQLQTFDLADDNLLAESYRAFHRSQKLRERFEEMEEEFDQEAAAVKIPRGLKKRVRAILSEHDDLRWDDAIQIVLDKTTLDRVREEKRKAKKKSGDFTNGDGDEEDEP